MDFQEDTRFMLKRKQFQVQIFFLYQPLSHQMGPRRMLLLYTLDPLLGTPLADNDVVTVLPKNTFEKEYIRKASWRG